LPKVDIVQKQFSYIETPSELEFPNNSILVELCGIGDMNIHVLEDKLGIQISRRGNIFSFSGNKKARADAVIVLSTLYNNLEEGRSLDFNDLDHVIDDILTKRPKKLEFPVNQYKAVQSPLKAFSIKTKKKLVEPRNNNQKEFSLNLLNYDLSFGIGPAGTGKTYMAIAFAVSMFLKGQVDRIVLTRPAVEAGERLGFLPGDIKDKIDPYMQPLYDALNDFLPGQQISKMIENKKIEILPLAFMRGRTLSNAFIILDEGQNASSNQMKMFLTRLGKNSKAVVTGDLTQIDLPKGIQSGLTEAVFLLKKIKEIGFTQFTESDVVRHKLVEKIIIAYGKNQEITG
jgi:phosphate starvation-inducible PhoH-like protein